MTSTQNHTRVVPAPQGHGDCVRAAAVDVFASTCGEGLQAIEDPGDLAGESVLIGVISIVGEVEWSVFLGLPRRTAETLAAKFAGFEIPFDSDDMGDAVGELTNILAGDIKRRLQERSVSAKISLPSVIRAESIEVLVQRATAAAKTCFVCEAGNLWTGVVSSKEGGLVA